MADTEYIGSGLPDGEILGRVGGKVSLYGGTPVARAAAITAATDLTTALVSVTALIAALKNVNLTA